MIKGHAIELMMGNNLQFHNMLGLMLRTVTHTCHKGKDDASKSFFMVVAIWRLYLVGWVIFCAADDLANCQNIWKMQIQYIN